MKKRNKCISRHLHPDPEHWVRKGQSWKAKVAYESEDYYRVLKAIRNTLNNLHISDILCIFAL